MNDSCPGCGQIEGVEQASTSPRVQAWSCTACGMNWAISVVNPHLHPALADLVAAAEEIGRLRCALRQVIALAGDACSWPMSSCGTGCWRWPGCSIAHYR